MIDSQDFFTYAAFLLWIGVFWFARMVKRLEATVDRIEAATFVVAEQRAIIAKNLAGSVSGADGPDGDQGAVVTRPARDDRGGSAATPDQEG